MDEVGGYATSGKVRARGCRPGGEWVTLCFRRDQQDKTAVEAMAVCRCVRYAEHRRGWSTRRRDESKRACAQLEARVARWCVSALSPVVVSVPECLLAAGQTVPEKNAAYGVSCPRLLRGVWQRRALFSAKAGLSPPQPAQIARMIPHRGQRDRMPRRWCCPPPPGSLTIQSQTRIASWWYCLVAARVSMACASLIFPLEPHARCYPNMI
jgi:hypothetical protein